MKLTQIKHRLIVSCQALPDEPLYSDFIMSRLALAAAQGGAAAIRANSVVDINAIQKTVSLPVFGIIKRDYPDSAIYITATMNEVKELLEGTTAEVIALDATARPRPNGEAIQPMIDVIHAAGRLAMADISNLAEGIAADKRGFDLISTTMSGYTPYTPERDSPDLELVAQLSRAVETPVIMEGHTWLPEDVAAAFEAGAYSAVVGGAITRPKQITAHYVEYLEKHGYGSAVAP